MKQLLQSLNRDLNQLKFSAPWVYNPWEYAQEPYLQYWQRYAHGPKQAVLLGMNPGPWGMAQTGIPFGEVSIARDWLKLDAPIGQPAQQHPKRPILGWACSRSEVSGRRLWGLLQEHFGSPERFFAWGFVANYCPLVFMQESGANLTPDKLPRSQRESLSTLCDRSLLSHLEWLQPKLLIGVGKWAEARALKLVQQHHLKMQVECIPHPSPANPAANLSWGQELKAWLP